MLFKWDSNFSSPHWIYLGSSVKTIFVNFFPFYSFIFLEEEFVFYQYTLYYKKIYIKNIIFKI